MIKLALTGLASRQKLTLTHLAIPPASILCILISSSLQGAELPHPPDVKTVAACRAYFKEVSAKLQEFYKWSLECIKAPSVHAVLAPVCFVRGNKWVMGKETSSWPQCQEREEEECELNNMQSDALECEREALAAEQKKREQDEKAKKEEEKKKKEQEKLKREEEERLRKQKQEEQSRPDARQRETEAIRARQEKEREERIKTEQAEKQKAQLDNIKQIFRENLKEWSGRSKEIDRQEEIAEKNSKDMRGQAHRIILESLSENKADKEAFSGLLNLGKSSIFGNEIQNNNASSKSSSEMQSAIGKFDIIPSIAPFASIQSRILKDVFTRFAKVTNTVEEAIVNESLDNSRRLENTFTYMQGAFSVNNLISHTTSHIIDTAPSHFQDYVTENFLGKQEKAYQAYRAYRAADTANDMYKFVNGTTDNVYTDIYLEINTGWYHALVK